MFLISSNRELIVCDIMYTTADRNYANIYANQRLSLLVLKKLYTAAPHLASHLEVAIGQADRTTDYYYANNFAQRAIKVKIKIGETACNKISCNSAKADGICGVTEQASYYRIGDADNFQLQCQPACFNLSKKVEYNDGEAKTQMVNTKFRNGKCIIFPSITSWMEHPLYRSSQRYEARVNDLPVGFNLGPENPLTTSGLSYEYNKSYCDSFFDEWSAAQKNCVTSIWMRLANAVVGESIIKYVRAGIQKLVTGSTFIRPDLGPVPSIENIWTVKGWSEDINTSFTLPDPDLSLDETTLTSPERSETKELYTTFSNLRQPRASQQSAEEILMSIINGLVDQFTTVDGLADLGLSMLPDAVAAILVRVLKFSADTILPKIGTVLVGMSNTLFTNVLRSSMLTVISNTVVKTLTNIAAKFAAAAAKLVAGAASVVGWILIIIAIFDLVLGFWDPLGFNSKYPKELLPQLVEQSEFALKQQLGSVDVELPFFTLANLVLGQQELAVTSIETLPYIYEYLSSLDVNAYGTRIDKGDEISNETAPSVDETIAKTKLYSPEELHEFEKVHARRLTFYKTGPTALLIMAGVFCACLVLGVWIGCIIAAILVGLLSFSLFANSVVGVFSTLDNIGIKL